MTPQKVYCSTLLCTTEVLLHKKEKKESNVTNVTIPVSFRECVWQFVNQRIIENLKKIMVQSIVLVLLHCSVPPALVAFTILITIMSLSVWTATAMYNQCRVISVLPALCTLFSAWELFTVLPFFLLICLSYLPSKTATRPLWKKHCLTAAKDAPAAFNLLRASRSLSLSVHEIQIISRASLCCCTERMRVFDLDLLDNIWRAQIYFHARLFHVDGVVQSEMLIFLEKLGKLKLN